MNLDTYQTLANRTAKEISPHMDLIHVALGLSGEAGEFTDAVKKYVIYGQELDRENLIEEAGDIFWFLAFACKLLGVTMSEVAQMNIDKLAKRYPNEYSDELAQLRLDKV